MVVRKIVKIGNSAAVTLPKDLLREARLRVGSKVVLEFDRPTLSFILHPKKRVGRAVKPSSITPQFVSRVDHFIKEYHPILKELAKV